MRWADQWRNPSTNLDLQVTSLTGHVDISSGRHAKKNRNHPLETSILNTFSSATLTGQLPSWTATAINNLPLSVRSAVNLLLGTDQRVLFPGENVSGGDYCVRVKHISGANPAWIQLQVFGGPPPGALRYSMTDHSIVNPAEAVDSNMLAVGAAPVNAAQPGLTPATIASSSSRGPLPTGSAVKPDIVGVSCTNSGARGAALSTPVPAAPFCGTSQAAPHVGGLAALVVQALTSPSGTRPAPTQVVGFLEQHALPRSENAPVGTPTPTPGRNNTWGHGFAYLPTLTPTPTAPPLGPPSNLSATASSTPGQVILRWTPGANATKHWIYGARGSQQVAWTQASGSTSHTVSGLDSGVVHRFSVTAGRGNQWSAWTSLVSVTPN